MLETAESHCTGAHNNSGTHQDKVYFFLCTTKDTKMNLHPWQVPESLSVYCCTKNKKGKPQSLFHPKKYFADELLYFWVCRELLPGVAAAQPIEQKGAGVGYYCKECAICCSIYRTRATARQWTMLSGFTDNIQMRRNNLRTYTYYVKRPQYVMMTEEPCYIGP